MQSAKAAVPDWLGERRDAQEPDVALRKARLGRTDAPGPQLTFPSAADAAVGLPRSCRKGMPVQSGTHCQALTAAQAGKAFRKVA